MIDNKSNSILCLNNIFPNETCIKLFALLYDKIYVLHDWSLDDIYVRYGEGTSWYDPSGEKTRKLMSKFIIPINKINKPFSLKKIHQRSYNKPLHKLADLLTNSIVQISKEKWGSSDTNKEDIMWVVTNELKYWRYYFPNSSLYGFLDSIRASNINVSSSTFYPYDKFEHFIKTVGIDLSHLWWSDIAKLRNSPFLKSFRSNYFYSRLNNSRDFNKHYSDVIDQIIDIVKPSKFKLIQILASSFPIGPINPVALASSVNEYELSTKLINDYGWIYFLKELNKDLSRIC